ncbi:MAG: CoB--CoM heterodisulfide reductase iron-sulfur subunit A family protein [Bacteroidales bacterium]|nr:CoB--CoM heterodisulfide reductase iron-sulfur subunit A family protein [Bacteroidales bacterium]
MEEIRIGVYICWCGSNIAQLIDVKFIAGEIKKLENVIISRDYKYMCSDPGQETLIADIKQNKLNRIVVAACSPRIHEPTFRKALEKAGLNPYMFQMANIREQDSWVHIDKEYATLKAVALVKAAVSRVKHHEPLNKKSVEVNSATMVIGGGITGLTSALEIAQAGKQVYLIEKSDSLGGITAKIDLTYPDLKSAGQMIRPKISQVQNHNLIEVFLNTILEDISGYVGNFSTKVRRNGTSEEITFGNIIVATGLKPFSPVTIPEYKYKVLPDVITSIELEKMLQDGTVKTSDGSKPDNIAIIHCVGSRNEQYHPYCSRTCCSTALKYANQLRSLLPDAHLFDIYADMRAYGKGCEEFYTNTSNKNIMFLMYDQKNGLPEIRKANSSDNAGMIITFSEKLSGENIEVPVDLVILMTAVEAHEDAKEVARLTGISLCGNDFYIEKHPKLDPVATTTDGVYIAGTCQGPKGIDESIVQAKAAAAKVLSMIAMGSIEIEVAVSHVNEEVCCGCQTCIMVCPYKAISFDEEKNVSVVNEALCKGCGTCGSTCPTGAIKSLHFTDIQILSQIEGLLKTESETI